MSTNIEFIRTKKDYSVHIRVNSDAWNRFQQICNNKGITASTVLNIFILRTNEVYGKNLATLLESPYAPTRL